MNPVNRPNASRRELMDVALGRLPADLIINNADVFNVWTGQVRKNMQVLVRKDRIAHVGGMESEGNTGDGARVIDAGGKVLIPGFIDSHTHLAWLVKPDQYAGRILPLGCTTVITETMEIYPVAGISGVREYISALQKQPMRFYTTLPAMTTINRSCMGMTGKDAKALDGMAGVGEAYWQTVLQNPDSFLPLFDRVLASGKVLEGHSAGAWGRKLSAYAALGVTSCHEAVSAEQVMERLEKGFHVQIREGSIRSELAALSAIAGQDIDLSNISLVSDGVTPGDLLSRGYMETIVQKAIDGGFRPDDAIRMATLNPARHFRLDHDIGSIAPGRFADMVLIPDLETIRPELVIAGGKVAAENQILKARTVPHDFSPLSLDTVKLPADITKACLAVEAPDAQGPVRVRAVEFVTDLVTWECICSLPVSNRSVLPDIGNDVIKAVALDRAKAPGKIFTGFVKGFGLSRGAVATSGGWDGSEIIALGTDDRDIALAVNRIRKDRGGIALAVDGRIENAFPLPVFGLLSHEPIERAAREIAGITERLQDLGCPLKDPMLSLSTLTGAAIPFLRISSEGLADLKTGENRALFLDYDSKG